jgi:hypothetical protein
VSGVRGDQGSFTLFAGGEGRGGEREGKCETFRAAGYGCESERARVRVVGVWREKGKEPPAYSVFGLLLYAERAFLNRFFKGVVLWSYCCTYSSRIAQRAYGMAYM